MVTLRKAKLNQKINLAQTTFELKFTTEQPFEFIAGQFITIKINDGKSPVIFRAFSISSSPQQKASFELCLKIVENGRGSNWLANLNKGEEIEFLGPNGNFRFRNVPDKNYLFIATGTGIAPLKAIIEDELYKGIKSKIHLIFGMRFISNLFYQNFFENLSKKFPNFTYEYILSRPENDSWKGKTGHVTDHLDTIPFPLEHTEVYVCGLTAMITDVQQILLTKKLNSLSIHFEKYD